MAITTRQNRTLAAEDWTRVYQSFRNADFQSYDFETLRKSMIDYIRLNYPENFNDYIESSEYVALIDLIAWLGQNLAFRTDLNARENFIDTAERRDSILKLAKLINYNPKRTISASGLLKIDSVSTTESVFDSDGVNLANVAISWNDPSNENWLEQFRTVVNAALINSQMIGKPGNSNTISGVRTDEYAINLTSAQEPIIRFQDTVNDVNLSFEAVSASSVGQDYLYELPPFVGQNFNLLYRNDNLGNSSNNTGFFLMFKQGQLASLDFSLAESLPNRIINVDVNDINNDDQWLYALDANGLESTAWTKTSAIAGINVIYNTGQNRNIYQVNSRANDQISLIFGDGSFANIPTGNYRFFYRVANGQTYKISSQELQNIVLSINYVSRINRIETLTIRASLKYTVTTASARETLAEIKTRAPQQYYTQRRMISGEDYNIFPYTEYSNIIKVKALNRTSSGISRFLEMVDASGKYSRTNIFAQDGILYKNKNLKSLTFSFGYSSEVDLFIRNTVTEYLSSNEMLHFYYENYAATQITPDHYWISISTDSNLNTGYFSTSALPTDPPTPATVGTTAGLPLSAIRTGSIVEFVAPPGYFFNAQNRLTAGTPINRGERTVLYTKIVAGTDGLGVNSTGVKSNGLGAISVNNVVPTGAKITQAVPSFANSLSDAIIDEIKQQMADNNSFGLVYDNIAETWSVESGSVAGEFDINDSTLNWLVLFTISATSNVYTVEFRSTEYIFESARETNFYFDKNQRIYDNRSGSVIRDQINILEVNTDPVTQNKYETDLAWNIYDSIIEIDGYQNPKRVLVTYADLDNDSVLDNPYVYEKIVRPGETGVNDNVFFRSEYQYEDFLDLVSVSNQDVVTTFDYLDAARNAKNLYPIGQIFYTSSEPITKFYQLTLTGSVRDLVALTGYYRFEGREALYFQYQHNADEYRRIDPSNTNIIDLYVLTQSFYNDYVAWLRDTTGNLTEPEQPTTSDLDRDFSGLDDVKSISDSLILNPARFKPLFGNKAEQNLRAVFKVVKNPNVNVSDNEIKTLLISAVNNFFDIENWDFGESFYFTELSAYLHSALTPFIASVLIVPTSPDSEFGDLFQINAEPYEIITSAATVDNVEIIPSVTSAQIGRLL